MNLKQLAFLCARLDWQPLDDQDRQAFQGAGDDATICYAPYENADGADATFLLNDEQLTIMYTDVYGYDIVEEHWIETLAY